MEVQDLPECCKDTLRQAERMLSAARALQVVLALAPSLTSARPTGITSGMAALWELAKAVYSFASNQGAIRRGIQMIVRQRVRDLIGLHALDHEGDAELQRHWIRLRDTFVS